MFLFYDRIAKLTFMVFTIEDEVVDFLDFDIVLLLFEVAETLSDDFVLDPFFVLIGDNFFLPPPLFWDSSFDFTEALTLAILLLNKRKCNSRFPLKSNSF